MRQLFFVGSHPVIRCFVPDARFYVWITRLKTVESCGKTGTDEKREF